MTVQQMLAMCSRFWLGYTALGAALLIAAGVVVTAGRSLWLLRRAAEQVSRLKQVPPPPRLTALASEIGIARLVCVKGAHPIAFCTGALRPYVLISEGLAARLEDGELAAVLLHEQDHLRRGEPLRRAIHQAVAWAFFYIPLLIWWSEGATERSELRADRSALARVAPQVLARALLRADLGTPQSYLTTAFAGAAEARVAQVLGDAVPGRRAELRLWALSASGISVALWGAHCIGGLLTLP